MDTQFPSEQPEIGMPPKHTRREQLVHLSRTAGLLLIAPVVAVVLTMFLFQTYQVSGMSMQPNLHNDDRLIVWKLPATWAHITGNVYTPGRGDVVIVKAPALLGLPPNETIIKRVIGLPGDRVVVKDTVLTVYNASHPDGFQPEKIFPYGKDIDSTNLDGDWTVGKDQIFVCGDNRYNSTDSRIFGPVSAKYIVGKLVLRVFPVDAAQRF